MLLQPSTTSVALMFMNHICVFSNKKQCSAFSSFPILPGIWLQMITSPRSSGVNQPLIKCLHCGAAGHWIHTDPQLASVSPESFTYLSKRLQQINGTVSFPLLREKGTILCRWYKLLFPNFSGCLDRNLGFMAECCNKKLGRSGF